MELKDNIKKLRKSKGITQAELADVIFVSRSTVAKWENGLSIPSPETMKALEEYFSVSPEELITPQPEEVISQKNRTIRTILKALAGVIAALLLTFTAMIPWLISSGYYGFTAEMAAGAYAKYPYIDTGDYRIYYSNSKGTWDDGSNWYGLMHFKIIQWTPLGWFRVEAESKIILDNLKMIGRLYTVKGLHGYYNIIFQNTGNNIPIYIVTVEEISIGRDTYDVTEGFYFTTPEMVDHFYIGDKFLDVE